jgi:cobalt-zinc-cadmium efflux system membrane fusion protein
MKALGRGAGSRFVLLAAVALLSCRKSHDHPHEHREKGSAEEAEEASLAITRWSDRHELFVELTAPRPGKPVSYHAHVTRLDGFVAVTEGTFKVRFKTNTGTAKEAVQSGVKRPGIFAFESPAPAAGEYSLEMAFEHAGHTDVFDCGTVVVADQPKPDATEAPGVAITFLKESQWKIPFATTFAEERSLANEMELPGTIEPAATDQLTVGAPTGGRFFHAPKIALGEGLAIKKGDVLGTILPTVAGDDYSRLQFAVEEARLARDQIQREIQRVEPLVAQNLLPERRLLELRNDLQTQDAKLSSASGRLGRVNAPGGQGGLPIKSALEGIVSEVLVPNGEPVEAGAPLVRIGGTEHLWIRTRFVAKPVSLLVDARPAGVRLPSGERLTFDAVTARFLSPMPVVDPATRIATWIVDIAPPAAGLPRPPAMAELRPGGSAVLAVRFGKPETRLAVPRSAVVEISTRPYVFVQVGGEQFEKRAVALGREDGPNVEVISGVKKGERVVEKGGYDVHLASLMGAVESHRH